MKIIYPANREKSKDVVNTLKNKIECRKQIYDGKEDSEGNFAIFFQKLV